MKNKTIVFAIVLALLASICSGCGGAAPQPDYWPTSDWRTSTPEQQGLDFSMILAMLDEIQNTKLGIDSLLIVRHGYLVTEIYFPPYSAAIKHPIFSMTKSVTSAMVGKAIQAGYIPGTQQKALELFPEIARDAKDPYVPDITIEQLLTMSAGFNTTTMPNLYGKDASYDAVRHILTYDSVLYAPGTTFFYAACRTCCPRSYSRVPV